VLLCEEVLVAVFTKLKSYYSNRLIHYKIFAKLDIEETIVKIWLGRAGLQGGRELGRMDAEHGTSLVMSSFVKRYFG
jgi:hypothetical protein